MNLDEAPGAENADDDLNFPAFSVLVLVTLLKVKGTAAAGLDVLVLEIIGLNPNSSWGVKFNGDCWVVFEENTN